MLSCGAVILAAGAGTRMGRLKQLLPYGDGTLLSHTVAQVSGAQLAPVVVVTGAEAEPVESHLAGCSIQLAHNPDWAQGMGVSLRTGVRCLLEAAPDVAGLALLLGDQPLVRSAHLRAMAAALATADYDSVAAEYSGTVGAPAFFRSLVFRALMEVPAEAGARFLLRSAGLSVLPFSLPEAAYDVDTPQDYERLSLL